MDSFLKNTAADILKQYDSLQDLVIVLPNRRAGLFFTRHLGNMIHQPQWLPSIKTIEDVFYEQAGNSPADQLTLIFELYKSYTGIQSETESFDRFYFWGEMILKDFNDVDQFMVEAKKLYHYLSEIKEIETDLSFLSDSQITLIREFWRSFEKQEKGHQIKFLKFWQLLYPLYESFKANLTVSGLAYGGMLYRQVSEKLDTLPKPDKQYIFVGFNAFTRTEENLIKHFLVHFDAKIYWDIDAYYLEDKTQEAGMFFREYQKDPVFGPTFPKTIPSLLGNAATKIHTYVTPLKVNQANLVGSLLEKIRGENKWEETVVILPDEQLLFPTLHVLPESIGKVNVTMGYPIRNTPVFAFLEAVLEMQRYIKTEKDKILFYHKPVKELLSSTYCKQGHETFIKSLLAKIEENNWIYVPQEALTAGGKYFELIFQKLTTDKLMDYLSELIRTLAVNLQGDGIQRSYLFQSFKQLNRLQAIFIHQKEVSISLEFFIRVFRQVFREIKLPFEGEPLEGLQVMGVLESRNLDFKRVIICNMNENSFPPSGSLNSMIPFNIRRAFGLPVQEQNDAIYAYTFYRLLHHAEEVHLIYTTSSEQGKVGERSRYIHQIMEEMNLPDTMKKEKVVYVPVDSKTGNVIHISKSPEVMRELEKYKILDPNKSSTAFSPSALNIWLDCRLKFYLRYIANLTEQEEVKEEVDPAVFGNLAHLSLEFLYKGFITRKKRDVFEKEDFDDLGQFIFPAIEKAIQKQYHLEEETDLQLTGQLAIARDVLQKYIAALLEVDKETAPFRIISLEADKKYRAAVTIDTGSEQAQIAVGGIIDRVDQVNERIRLIDYKSGLDTKNFGTIESLFDRNARNRNKAAMQTLFYGLLYLSKFPENLLPLQPAIFNLREIFSPDFNPYLQHKPERDIQNEVRDYRELQEEFEAHLKSLLEEIYNPSVPFDQTGDLDKCKICPYKNICGR